MSFYTCVHCGQKFRSRSGRGLCRKHWLLPHLRAKYPVVAKFGGPTAAVLVKQKRVKQRPPKKG